MDIEDLRLLRHAVGFSGRSPGYRNRYSASNGTPEFNRWVAMCANGLAEATGDDSLCLAGFRATAKGCEAAGLTEEQTRKRLGWRACYERESADAPR